jgi:hypothetical protein
LATTASQISGEQPDWHLHLAEGDKVLTGPIRKLKELKDKASASLRARSDTDLAKTKDAKK